MLPDRELGYLEDIRIYAARAMTYASGVTLDGFLADVEKRDAILHCVTMVGEIARRLSPDARNELPQFDWRAMGSVRNFIVHEYDRVDLVRIWQITQVDLPPLVDALTKYLSEFP